MLRKLCALKRPPLVLEGDGDGNVTPADVEIGVAAMGKVGLEPRYVLLPGHDHFMMFTARERVFGELQKLLKS